MTSRADFIARSMRRVYFGWRPHRWHGLEPGPDAPRVVNAYIEITPFDVIEYAVDKVTGDLRLDRPQRTSSQPPALIERLEHHCSTCKLVPGEPAVIRASIEDYVEKFGAEAR